MPDVTERTDEASIKANGLSGPFAEIEFDIHLTSLVNGVDNQINEQRRRAAA
ncbi:Catechol 1,2-dioxygenase [compost metagenome]